MQTKPTPTEGQNSDKLEAESALRGAACSLCGGSGTRIIGERDGKNFWNRCVPCDCQSDPLIPVRASQWALLNQCAKDRDEMKNALEYILGIGLTAKTQARAEKALGIYPANDKNPASGSK
jgi:hypothetical protein